ncbi:MAG: Mth938-like domain-containing protein [Pelomonas sp.]|nr:Mth938-like domain-containing protein [Roseateles sp.]
MKFQLDQQLGGNTVSRVEPGCAWVNGRPWQRSVLVPWQGDTQAWAPTRFEDLAAEHFEQILALRPELVILGSGAKLRFVPPALYRGLIGARIGVETMDFAAACRTYNVLAAEGRAVLAALLIEA